MSQGRRDLAERFDQFCGRLNDGLMAETIVLAALALLAGVYRVAETLVIPQGLKRLIRRDCDHLADSVEVLPSRPAYSGSRFYWGGNAALVGTCSLHQ